MSTEIEYSLNDTVVHVTDNDNEQLRLAYFGVGRDGSPAEVIASVEKGRQVAAEPKELIEAIAKISGLKVNFDQQWIAKLDDGSFVPIKPAEDPAPHPELWTNVRYRAARAVEVTPELVLALRDGPPRPELGELSPWFSPTTGEPAGVKYFDPQTYNDHQVGMGLYVVLRHGQPPQALGKNEFEDLYEEAA